MELGERLEVLLAATDVEELGGGHQARVFRVVRRVGDVVVAMVLDATLVDRYELETRLAVIAALSDLDRRVCRPVANDDGLVGEATGDDARRYYVVCFEFADGTAPDPARAADANQRPRGRPTGVAHPGWTAVRGVRPPLSTLRRVGDTILGLRETS